MDAPGNFNWKIGSNRAILCPVFLIERHLEVRFQHRIVFTEDVFNPSNPVLRDLLVAVGRPPRVMVVLDEALAAAQPGMVLAIVQYFGGNPTGPQLVCPPLVVEGGERAKNSWFHVTEIHSHVDRFHMDRHSYVIAVGGGALLDVVGLAAALAHRGLRLIRVPTTTLAQNDSGVGVKNGVNAFGKKNFIGSFAPPWAVVNDFKLLESLPLRDKRAGLAEAVKVALIRDARFFERLESEAARLAQFEREPAQYMIRRCAELHVDHICAGGDPFEMGSARPLDFGHWSAHKLEALSNYELRHGEAVAIGIALDTLYSRNIGWLDAASAERVLALLERLGFKLFAPELMYRDPSGTLQVLLGLQEFREHLGGELSLTLLREIGCGVEAHEMEPSRVQRGIEELKQRAGA